jgi:hypothetical protein
MDGIELGKSPWENRIAFISASIAQRLSHGFPRRPMQSQTELKVTSGIIPDVDFSFLSFREAYLASRLSGHESCRASHPAHSLAAHCCAAAPYRLLLTGRKSGQACRLPPVSEVVPSTDTGEQRAVRGWAGIPRRARPLPEFEARTSQTYRFASAARCTNVRRQTPPAYERPQETWLTKSG